MNKKEDLIKKIKAMKATIKELCDNFDGEILITNINEANMLKQQYYCITIDQKHIAFAQKRPTQKMNLNMDLLSFKLSLNHQPVGPEYTNKLITKINAAITDVKTKKARLFKKES